MIEFLNGRLAAKQATRLVIDVGGVAFGLDVSLRASEKAGNPGDTVQVLTYLHVREEALDLYGFVDAAERALFLKLIGVSGVGPRLALRILSAVSPQQLANMILHSDVRNLTALKGVGKKTAEVLIASLRASMSKLDLPTDGTASPGTEASAEGGIFRDAVMALVSLGVKDPAAQEAVRKASQKLGPDVTTSALISQALQEA
ncbi:MAG: Holliday junction helicase RuvA [Fibrobacteria bacterium]|nr:Holliday junction helicase RuvA [Fibrobacteria bacterium]